MKRRVLAAVMGLLVGVGAAHAQSMVLTEQDVPREIVEMFESVLFDQAGDQCAKGTYTLQAHELFGEAGDVELNRIVGAFLRVQQLSGATLLDYAFQSEEGVESFLAVTELDSNRYFRLIAVRTDTSYAQEHTCIIE